ncbi:succinate--CoA ligase subunit alpha [Myxacorys almedinensis]|uniref:CoA-binding protein n=1 Tax=Myxacorys almedinensis A TaxID=2690445 RepID=A0A8J8CL06_9CYAN|nr:CoA-binding protein [Myxacorys almedinensis]NDJ19131.1 CoA-binding protein [Myxacorys almedinensis A]
MNFTATNTVIIQGITEPLGACYAPLMQAYGTTVVAGISSGNGGRSLAGIPVFDMVEQALSSVGAIDTSVIFSPPYAALDAALEAIAAGVRTIILVSQGVPPLDMVHLIRKAEATETLIVGPNSPGIIVPHQLLLGIHPPELYKPGSVGILSRNGTLTYEVAWSLSQAGIGQSIAVSIGDDAIVGSTLPQWLQMLDEDDQTDAIVLVGEIGGDSEELAAHYIAEAIDKPVIAYIAGRSAPRGRRMGHAGAIIESQATDFGPDIGTAESKITALKRAGVPVAERPSEIPEIVRKLLKHPLKKVS